MSEVVIVGGGAAGLMAGAESAKKGNQVTIIEKMSRPARKVMISGRGRCNLTNAVFELDDLIAAVPSNPRFLYSAFSNFMPYDTIAFMEDMGVATKIERGNRVFPASDKAVDVVDALVKNAKRSGAQIIRGTVKALEQKGNVISAAVLEDGRKILCDKIALCTGGMSYPATGSTGDGYRLAESAGHHITEIKPGLVPLISDDAYIPRLQGLSLKNIRIDLFENGEKIYSDFGEMLFTHFGISGPVVLSASSHINGFSGKQIFIMLDLKPALDEGTLDRRVRQDFAQFSNKAFVNSLSRLLPKKLIPVIVDLSGIEPLKTVNQITKQERIGLVRLLKNIKINLTDFYHIDSAVITRGGIDVKEIDPATMKSKIVNNLFFAGEIMDVDAYTGGFNLQIAFSTGVLCGQRM